MDFDLTDEQRLLADSVHRFVSGAYPDLETRKAYRAEPAGYAAANWAAMAEMGLLALPLPEDQGAVAQAQDILDVRRVGSRILSRGG
jgi:alkylation response protein AidB-like acyl-CoA dehydrogenase